MSVQAGWQPDPMGRHEFRYWDGASWTEHVASGGEQGIDPLGTAEPDSESPGAGLGIDELLERDVPRFGARRYALSLQEEARRLADIVRRHGLLELAEAERAVERERSELARVSADVERSRSEKAHIDRTIVEARAQLLDLRTDADVQEQGLYDFEHIAEDSVALSTQLAALRADIKLAVREGRATTASDSFTYNGSAAQGRKFVKDMSKLMLRSYNAEAENGVKSVKAGNLATAQARLSKAVEQIERLGKLVDLKITSYYHSLRLKELELANRHLLAVKAEKEAERAHREELREQRKVERALAAEKERLQKERSHYANTIAALEAKGDVEGAARMKERLDDVDHAIENVDYRAANIRAGYVYVISNVGSFGAHVVKIGLTRRLDPMDRVNELGDASVPFRFDVHALFFADDAVTVESALHQHFSDRRLNRVNMRREYFRATPQEVLDALKAHDVEVVDFRVHPDAEEFKASEALVEAASG